jgi:hypothetical protein
VTIELSDEEFEALVLALGTAAGAAGPADRPWFWALIKLANAVNRSNPRWTPYEIPKEYQ